MRFVIPEGQKYVSPGTIAVEGDASSASYFLGGAAITGGPVTVRGCGKDSVQVRHSIVNFAAALRLGYLSPNCSSCFLAPVVTSLPPLERTDEGRVGHTCVGLLCVSCQQQPMPTIQRGIRWYVRTYFLDPMK